MSIRFDVYIEMIIGIMLSLLMAIGAWFVYMTANGMPVTVLGHTIVMSAGDLTTFVGYFIISLGGTLAVAILYFTGKMTGLCAHFAVLSMTVSGLLLLSQLVFRGKYFLSELNRWLHL